MGGAFQVACHLARRRVAVVRILGHRLLDHRIAPGGQVGFSVQYVRYRLHQVHQHHLDGRIRLVRGLSTQHLEDKHAQGIDIAAPIDGFLALHLLRAHECRRADDGAAGQCAALLLLQAGDAEVG